MIQDKIKELETKINDQNEIWSKELAELKVLANKEEEFKDGQYLRWKGKIDCFSATKDAIALCRGVREDQLLQIEFLADTASGQMNGGYKKEYFVKITKEEAEKLIEQKLISDAEKKGFVKGAKVKGVRQVMKDEKWRTCGSRVSYDHEITFTIKEIREINYISESDTLYTSSDGVFILYEKGKWAEIITSHPEITINGYKAEFKEDGVVFGCKAISKETILHIQASFDKLSSLGLGVNMINLDHAGNISANTIKEIANYYKTASI